MSFRVVNEVLEHSKAELADRLVAVTIAEVAHHDGVGWLPQGPPADRPHDRKNIAARARVSVRQVKRSIAALGELDELEIRTAQRGRRRINVYWLKVGSLVEAEIDYERLPFELDRPFGRGDNLSPGEVWGRGDDLAPRHGRDEGTAAGDQVTGDPSRGDTCDTDRVTDRHPPHAREISTVLETVPRTVQGQNGPAAEAHYFPPSVAHDEKQSTRESAAASEVEAPRLSRVVEVVNGLRGSDFASLRSVEPLAMQLPASAFEDVVERVHARRGVENPPGLLVHLLRVELEQRYRGQREAAAAAGDAALESQLAARRRNPRSWLHRLLALPQPATGEFVDDFLARYVDDVEERERLAAEAAATRAALASAVTAIQHWITWVSPELDREVVHVQIDEWLDLAGVTDWQERSALHEAADDARERPALEVVAGTAEASAA